MDFYSAFRSEDTEALDIPQDPLAGGRGLVNPSPTSPFPIISAGGRGLVNPSPTSPLPSL